MTWYIFKQKKIWRKFRLPIPNLQTILKKKSLYKMGQSKRCFQCSVTWSLVHWRSMEFNRKPNVPILPNLKGGTHWGPSDAKLVLAASMPRSWIQMCFPKRNIYPSRKGPLRELLPQSVSIHLPSASALKTLPQRHRRLDLWPRDIYEMPLHVGFIICKMGF